ncbi:MAG TPA: hypothetical protein VFM85_04105 [Actinomycetota bacterium]|nr:hypothetical protein [Actinomycetota bacterium]
MNAGLAVWNDFAYVGSRTDGSKGHPHAGVLVVDIHDPGRPKVVGEIGPPDEGNPSETSRELRIWPRKHLLLVLNFRCDPLIHDCRGSPLQPTVRFYDIGGKRAAKPVLVSTYHPQRTPHEFFLWQDPNDQSRALLYLSTPGYFGGDLLVTDISSAREGAYREVASWSTAFPDLGPNDELHSLSVSPDGTRAYLAFLTAGFFVLDTSEVAKGLPAPDIHLVTPLTRRVRWAGPGPHSAVKVPGRDLVLTTDEVYGGIGPDEGCPWGWVHLIDVTDERSPYVVSEYRVAPYNEEAYCDGVSGDRNMGSSFSSHNPTVTEHLALVTWHSAGIQLFSTVDPARPTQLAAFVPEPLGSVATEDPALSSGPDHAVMWSYPIVKDGLIYVVDIRNGLFVLKYHGPHEGEVASTGFLEGNSNLGDES